MKGTKMRSLITAVVVSLAAMAMAAFLAGCGSSPSTLEEYFEANPDEYAEVESAFQEGFSSSMGTDVPAEASLVITGNDMECRVDIGMSFTDEEVAAIQSELDNQFNLYTAQMQELITQLEDESGYSPITLTLSYYDENGTLLGSHTYSK